MCSIELNSDMQEKGQVVLLGSVSGDNPTNITIENINNFSQIRVCSYYVGGGGAVIYASTETSIEDFKNIAGMGANWTDHKNGCIVNGFVKYVNDTTINITSSAYGTSPNIAKVFGIR